MPFTPTKIIISGPESSGKTTLAHYLSKHYRIPLVDEYAVSYLENNGIEYKEGDVVAIGREQKHREEEMASQHPLIVCDTDEITIDIWLKEVYGSRYGDFLGPLDVENKIYLLCFPDIPWEYHPMRQNPHDRHRLYGIHEQLLLELQAPFYCIQGSLKEREQRSKEIIDALIIESKRDSSY